MLIHLKTFLAKGIPQALFLTLTGVLLAPPIALSADTQLTKSTCEAKPAVWNETAKTCTCDDGTTVIKTSADTCPDATESVKTDLAAKFKNAPRDPGGYLAYLYDESLMELRVLRLNTIVDSVEINGNCFDLGSTRSLAITGVTKNPKIKIYDRPHCQLSDTNPILESGVLACSATAAETPCVFSADPPEACEKRSAANPDKCLCQDGVTQVDIGSLCPSRCSLPDTTDSTQCACPDGTKVKLNADCPERKPVALTEADCKTATGAKWNTVTSSCECEDGTKATSKTSCLTLTLKCTTPDATDAKKCKCTDGTLIPVDSYCKAASDMELTEASCANIESAKWDATKKKCMCTDGFVLKNMKDRCSVKCDVPDKTDPEICRCVGGNTVTLGASCPALTSCSEKLDAPLVNPIPAFTSDANIAFNTEGNIVGAPVMVLAKGKTQFCDTSAKHESAKTHVSAVITSAALPKEIKIPAFFAGSLGTEKCPPKLLFGGKDQNEADTACGCGDVWAIKYTPEKEGEYTVNFVADTGSEAGFTQAAPAAAKITAKADSVTDADHSQESFYRKGILRGGTGGYFSFGAGHEFFVPIGFDGPDEDIMLGAVFPFLVLKINSQVCTLYDYVRMVSGQGLNLIKLSQTAKQYSVVERLALLNFVEYMQSQGIAAYIAPSKADAEYYRQAFSLFGYQNAVIWAEGTPPDFNAHSQPILGVTGVPRLSTGISLDSADTAINELQNGAAGILPAADSMTPWMENNSASLLQAASDITQSASYALTCIKASSTEQTLAAGKCSSSKESCVSFSNKKSKMEIQYTERTGESSPAPGGSCGELEATSDSTTTTPKVTICSQEEPSFKAGKCTCSDGSTISVEERCAETPSSATALDATTCAAIEEATWNSATSKCTCAEDGTEVAPGEDCSHSVNTCMAIGVCPIGSHKQCKEAGGIWRQKKCVDSSGKTLKQ